MVCFFFHLVGFFLPGGEMDGRGEGTSKMQIQNYLSSGNMPEGRAKIPTVVIFGMSCAFVLSMMKKKC